MEKIKFLLSIILSGISYFLGGFEKLLNCLLILMIVDYITGVLVAIKNKKLNSKIGFKGITKKIFILVIIGIANLLSITYNIESIRSLAISFYIVNEYISIMENAGKFKVPIPKKLLDTLEQLRKEDEK